MSIKDMINQAYSKDASGFEATFNSVMADKVETALGSKFDSMYGDTQMELPLEDTVDSEEPDLETE